MVGETQIVVHPKWIPTWHYNEYAGHARQAVLLTAQEYQHCPLQHHTDPNPHTS